MSRKTFKRDSVHVVYKTVRKSAPMGLGNRIMTEKPALKSFWIDGKSCIDKNGIPHFCRSYNPLHIKKRKEYFALKHSLACRDLMLDAKCLLCSKIDGKL